MVLSDEPFAHGEPLDEFISDWSVALVKLDGAMGEVTVRFDVLVVHRGDGGGELAADIIGFSSSFGDITNDPAFEPNRFGNIDEDGEVEVGGDLREAEQQDAFDDDHRFWFDHHNLAGAGVGCEVVHRRSDRSATSQRLNVGREHLMVERTRVVVVDQGAIGGREVTLVAVVGIERYDGDLVGPESFDEVPGERGLAGTRATTDSAGLDHGSAR